MQGKKTIKAGRVLAINVRPKKTPHFATETPADDVIVNKVSWTKNLQMLLNERYQSLLMDSISNKTSA